MLRHVLLSLHLFSVIIWVGGMFFAYFCLRPAAATLLEPQQRLPLWVDTLQRFFKFTTVAVVVIIASGLTLFLQVGFKLAPPGWHTMLSIGLLMAAIFAYVAVILLPRLRKQCEAATLPAAAQTLNAIRKMVGLNLILSVIVIIAAISSR